MIPAIATAISPPTAIAAKAAVVLVWLGLVGGLAEGLRRWSDTNSEVTRKIVHIGAGQVILLAWWLQTPTWMGIAASVTFAAIALLSYRFPILPGINSVGRPSLGTFFYAVSIGVLMGLFWPPSLQEYAAVGILIMTWGDGLAALVGQNYGRHPYKIGAIQKSWEGSLAMLVVSFGVCLLVLGLSQGFSFWGLGQAIIVALAATALEAFSKFGIDNLTVPISSAILAYLLG